MNRAFIVFCILTSSLFSQISHQSFFGGPFQGISKDFDESLINQVGEFANFSVNRKIVAKANSRVIDFYKGTQLKVFFLLDDGTISTIPTEKIAWKHDFPQISINNGFIEIAEKINTKFLRLTANYGEFSTNLYLKVDNESFYKSSYNLHKFPESLRLAQDSNLDEWKTSDWLGSFYKSDTNWIYHPAHGWLFAVHAKYNTIWFWHPDHQWIWTGEELYPYLFRNTDASWIYFVKKSTKKEIYYNFSLRKFEF